HDQVALRIHDGAFSAMDLTARHPRTGDLQSRPTSPTPSARRTWKAAPSPPSPATTASAAGPSARPAAPLRSARRVWRS
ncbi:hypothetical protein ABZ862_36120, partial [Streptomyces sp. NPDC047000]